MRRKALALFSVLAVIALASAAAGARGSNPQIQREQAHARAVLAKINQIGASLEKTVQAYDGAKIQLAQVETSLKRNEYALRVARKNLNAAQKRIMSRLRELYVNGEPTALDVLAGAQSLSQVIDRLESAQVLSSQDAAIGKQAVTFQLSVQQRERLLQHERAKRVAVVQQLATRRQTIEGALAQQKQLYASDKAEIQKLQQQEAARQEHIRELAAARIQAQIAQQRQQARETILQQQQAQAPVQSSGGDPSGSGGSTGGGTDPPPAPAPVPVSGGGGGHPAAAQIALRYLGVPYAWGGAGPGGFDCSGLVMYVYAQLGISLPHYTVAQWSSTEPISMSQLEPGDLVFFNGLSHVGIYIGNGQMVNAPHTGSVVRIDSISGFGSIDGARRVP